MRDDLGFTQHLALELFRNAAELVADALQMGYASASLRVVVRARESSPGRVGSWDRDRRRPRVAVGAGSGRRRGLGRRTPFHDGGGAWCWCRGQTGGRRRKTWQVRGENETRDVKFFHEDPSVYNGSDEGESVA